MSISKQSQHAIINIWKRNRCHSHLGTRAVVHWLEIPHKETMKSSVGMATFGNKPAAVLSISGLWKSLITAVRVFFAIKVMYMRSFYLFFEMISALPMQMFFFKVFQVFIEESIFRNKMSDLAKEKAARLLKKRGSLSSLASHDVRARETFAKTKEWVTGIPSHLPTHVTNNTVDRCPCKGMANGGQTRSWRAGVLQGLTLAPTYLNTPAWKLLVCLVSAWLTA